MANACGKQRQQRITAGYEKYLTSKTQRNENQIITPSGNTGIAAWLRLV